MKAVFFEGPMHGRVDEKILSDPAQEVLTMPGAPKAPLMLDASAVAVYPVHCYRRARVFPELEAVLYRYEGLRP